MNDSSQVKSIIRKLRGGSMDKQKQLQEGVDEAFKFGEEESPDEEAAPAPEKSYSKRALKFLQEAFGGPGLGQRVTEGLEKKKKQ